jgi:Spy/CpxP family protein refolding chaperone
MRIDCIRWLVPGVSAVLVACAGGATPPAPVPTPSASVAQPPASSAPVEPVASAPKPHREHGPARAGVAGMMLHAAHDLQLKDAQTAELDKLEQQLHPDDAPLPAEFKEYQTALAAGVRAGKIDAAKLPSLQSGVEKAMQARMDKQVEVLNGLHAVLDAGQRKALVAAVRTRQADMEKRAAERKPEGAKPAPADWDKRRLERMTKELELDAGQQKKVEALLGKTKHPAPPDMAAMRDEMKKRNEAMLTAFEADAFDAKKLDMAPAPKGKPGEGADKHVEFLNKLVAILKPPQREKLAARLENPPMRGPREGMHHGPRPGHGSTFDEPEGEPPPATK